MKIYTKNGDTGKTSLLGKTNIYKNNPIIEAYGTIDELNSLLGICITQIINKKIKLELNSIQNNLFLIGSYLADVNRQFIKIKDLNKLETQTLILEREIDKMEKNLLPLTNFILPGGSKESSFIHLARTVTRRAERKIVKVNKQTPVNENVLMYINRLSDYLFVLARYLNKKANLQDTIWKL